MSFTVTLTVTGICAGGVHPPAVMSDATAATRQPHAPRACAEPARRCRRWFVMFASTLSILRVERARQRFQGWRAARRGSLAGNESF